MENEIAAAVRLLGTEEYVSFILINTVIMIKASLRKLCYGTPQSYIFLILPPFTISPELFKGPYRVVLTSRKKFRLVIIKRIVMAT